MIKKINVKKKNKNKGNSKLGKWDKTQMTWLHYIVVNKVIKVMNLKVNNCPLKIKFNEMKEISKEKQ